MAGSATDDAATAHRPAEGRRVAPPGPRGQNGPVATVRSLAGSAGPVVAVTDFMKAVPDQISRFVPGPFTSLGTDGFGRSDTREALRRHFEVDAEHVVVAVLASLVATGRAKGEEVAQAIAAYGIDAEAIDPRLA